MAFLRTSKTKTGSKVPKSSTWSSAVTSLIRKLNSWRHALCIRCMCLYRVTTFSHASDFFRHGHGCSFLFQKREERQAILVKLSKMPCQV